MDEITAGGGWESWIQTVGGGVIEKYASANWTQPFELQKLRIQSNSEMGIPYTEGEPGQRANGLGISPGVLMLAGAAVLVLVLLKD